MHDKWPLPPAPRPVSPSVTLHFPIWDSQAFGHNLFVRIFVIRINSSADRVHSVAAKRVHESGVFFFFIFAGDCIKSQRFMRK